MTLMKKLDGTNSNVHGRQRSGESFDEITTWCNNIPGLIQSHLHPGSFLMTLGMEPCGIYSFWGKSQFLQAAVSANTLHVTYLDWYPFLWRDIHVWLWWTNNECFSTRFDKIWKPLKRKLLQSLNLLSNTKAISETCKRYGDPSHNLSIYAVWKKFGM